MNFFLKYQRSLENHKTNILIIAYAFAPNKSVGAMRPTYWFRALPEALNAEVDVITGEKNASGENIHVVLKAGSSWLTRFVADVGVVWKKNIVEYLKNNPSIKPDYVIITGGPFMHFGISSWLKSNYGCKVILDYRDPFATNPLFGNNWLKSSIKKFFERRFNKKADALITVNKYCGELLSHFDKKPNAIVQNGFDETVQVPFNDVKLGASSTLSCAGKFYFDPLPMQKAIEKAGLSMTYIGPDENQLDLTSESIISKGFVDYKTALEIIGSEDIGIIQTVGFKHLSTTKIFDYIRCNRVILIISMTGREEGSIHEELKGYPNVFWTKNDTESILKTLELIKNSKYILPKDGFAEKYSRKHQLQNLIKLINEITE